MRRIPPLDPLATHLYGPVLDAMGDAVIVTTAGINSPEPRIVYANPAFEQLTGYTRQEVIGQSPRILQGPETDRKALNAVRQALKEGEESICELINYKEDGTPYSVEMRVSPLKNDQGEIVNWIGVLREVSEREAGQAELRQINQRLEERVKVRTAALQEANEELMGFIYTVSHDFRAPLRAIMSSCYVLLEDYADRLDPEGVTELERQSTAAKRLGVLMDDLLKLSRLARQEMTLEDVDLSSLAHEVVDEILVRTTAPHPEISVYPDMVARGDSRLLKLLLQNLIENAVKFSRTIDYPRIVIGKEGERFFVRDNGIGFKPEYATKIFLPFERLHSEEDYKGTGVGLANVKRIVDKHGGRITAEGEPGEGATFWFTLSE